MVRFHSLILLITLCITPLPAAEDLHLFELDATINGDTMSVTGTAVPILAEALFRDQFLELPTSWPAQHFDAHFRYGLSYLAELDKLRPEMNAFLKSGDFAQVRMDQMLGNNDTAQLDYLPLIHYPMKIYCYGLKGDLLQKKDISVGIGLTSIPNQGYILYDKFKLRFPIAETLNNNDKYQEWLKNLIFADPIELKNPKTDQFLLQIIGDWPMPYNTGGAKLGQTTAPPSYLFHSDWQLGMHPQVALSLMRKDGDRVQSSDFEALKQYAATLNNYRAYRMGKEDPDARAVYEFLDMARVSPPALRSQVMHLLNQGLEKRALDLYHRHEPFLAGGFHQDIPTKLRAKIQDRLDKLNADRDKHPRAEGVSITFQDLAADDVIGGSMNPTLTIEGATSPLLQLDLFLDDEKIASYGAPPYRLDGENQWPRGIHRLRALAWFEDSTWSESELRFKGIDITDEARTHLLPLRAVVTKGRGFITDLNQEDFSLQENGHSKEIIHFRRETRPLRISLLMDISYTMQGMKHRRAAYAGWSFIKNLDPEDKVSLYAFNDEVMRLSDFTNDADSILAPAYTLHARGSTALYDALWAAHDDLIDQDGNRIIVVLSDGVDNSSRTTLEQINTLFKDSPVMVYSVFIPPESGGFRDDPKLAEGRRFLDDLAAQTGSVSLKIKSMRKLDEKLAEIYTELKSFYYLDYYTTYLDPEQRAQILDSSKGVVRFRHFPIEEQER